MRTKIALCVGINTYAAAPLSGCVNDALGWTDLLRSQGYNVTQLLDHAATKSAVVAELHAMVKGLHYGDRLVFTYSGHGTYVPDTDGDEPDGRDEALALYDYQQGGLLLDDEMHWLFSDRRFGTRVSIFSDSCYSGTVSRRISFAGDRSVIEAPRFLDPSTFLQEPNARRAAQRIFDAETFHALRPTSDGVRSTAKRSGTPLFSGCKETEVSYDAFIDGRPQGAFSAAALSTFTPGITYRRWHEAIRAVLPSRQYPQTPELYSSVFQRGWSL